MEQDHQFLNKFPLMKRDSENLLSFLLQNNVLIISSAISHVCSLKYLCNCFPLLFLFSIFCCFPVCPSIDIAVTGCSNKSFSSYFYFLYFVVYLFVLRLILPSLAVLISLSHLIFIFYILLFSCLSFD